MHQRPSVSPKRRKKPLNIEGRRVGAPPTRRVIRMMSPGQISARRSANSSLLLRAIGSAI